MRIDDAIYGFRVGAFAVVMVAPNAAALTQINQRLIRSLDEVRGSTGHFKFETQIISYPEEAKTAFEMEQTARTFLQIDQPAAPQEVAPAKT